MKNKLSFFQNRDPDLEIFSQAFAMLISNLLGLFLWVILRFPCSMLIVLAPGIIVAIVFKEITYSAVIKISLISSTVISIFYIGTIMLHSQPFFQIVWVAVVIYFIFSSYKTRYLASFVLLPCSLAFNMPLGALSATNRVFESFLSALLAIITVVVIKELAAKYKVKRILLLLILETRILYKLKLLDKAGLDGEISNLENKIKLLTLKSVYLIKKYNYLQKNNRRYSQHASILLDAIIKISRAVTMLTPVRYSSCLNSKTSVVQNTCYKNIKTELLDRNPYIDKKNCDSISGLQTIENNLNNIYCSTVSDKAVNIHTIDICINLQEKLSFNNYFSIKNLMKDMEKINNFQLQK